MADDRRWNTSIDHQFFSKELADRILAIAIPNGDSIDGLREGPSSRLKVRVLDLYKLFLLDPPTS